MVAPSNSRSAQRSRSAMHAEWRRWAWSSAARPKRLRSRCRRSSAFPSALASALPSARSRAAAVLMIFIIRRPLLVEDVGEGRCVEQPFGPAVELRDGRRVQAAGMIVSDGTEALAQLAQDEFSLAFSPAFGAETCGGGLHDGGGVSVDVALQGAGDGVLIQRSSLDEVAR